MYFLFWGCKVRLDNFNNFAILKGPLNFSAYIVVYMLIQDISCFDVIKWKTSKHPTIQTFTFLKLVKIIKSLLYTIFHQNQVTLKIPNNKHTYFIKHILVFIIFACYNIIWYNDCYKKLFIHISCFL